MGKSDKKTIAAVIGTLHHLSAEEVSLFRKRLLIWYDDNKRVLPWRSIAATEPDHNKRVYAVWVSEMMLQQTQVATVINYFEKWMAKWPTVTDLAEATLEEVNQIWAGLGYYSRARRLHEGALKIVKEMNGNFPTDRDSLIEHLPGVGRYSGSAIASIALGNAVGVVDGNVNRVMARVRAIGADLANQSTVNHMWNLVDEVVDPKRPGDFNQAIMELGATICTPKTPNCASCPIQGLCIAYRKNEGCQNKLSIVNHLVKVDNTEIKEDSKVVDDIECLPNCDLCLRKEDWDCSLGVQNYPRKPSKTQVRQQISTVIVIESTDGQMLLLQRPKSGLLANLWEFPSILLEGEDYDEKLVTQQLSKLFSLPVPAAKFRSFVADVVHVFSHIRQTYKVYRTILKDDKGNVSWPSNYQDGRWMTKEEFLTSATSTAMKKVLKAVEASDQKVKEKSSKRTSCRNAVDTKKQKTISQFFMAAPKK